MTGLEFAKYRFVIRPRDKLILPTYKGSTFRGGFGHVFKRTVCTTRDTECSECYLRSKCIYSYIFETSPPPETDVLRRNSDIPRPFVIEPPLEENRHFTREHTLSFNLILIGRAIDYFPYFLFTFEELGKVGIGKERGKYYLENVYSIGLDKEGEIYSRTDRMILEPGFTITSSQLTGLKDGKAEGIEIEFLTPGRFKYDGTLVSELEFHILLRSLLGRISSLMYFHCGERLEIDFRELIDEAKDVLAEEEDLKWKDWERYSTKQDERMKLGGLVGRIRFVGRMEKFLPYLLLGEHIHVGKGTPFGLGKYQMKGTKEVEDKVLFSSLGLSPGSLFTAIVHTKPDRVVVITSTEGSRLVDEIIAKSKEVIDKEFTAFVYTISDPFTAFDEGRELAKSLVEKKGKENIVNIAGGTTALQDAVQCLSGLIDAKEIAVVDRRPYQEQKANPYVVGELVEVPSVRK